MPPVTRVTGGTTPKPAAAVGKSAAGLKNDRFVGNPVFESVASGKATLAVGARGPAVVSLQRALADMGFTIRDYKDPRSGKSVVGADGAYGGVTTTAVKNFQVHASKYFPNVKVTGTVDAATLKALDALAPRAGAKAWAPGQSNVKVPTPFYNGKPVRVVVVKDEHRTFLYDKTGKCTGIFANAVGNGAEGNATDEGLKKVYSKLGEADSRNVGVTLWKDPLTFGPRIINLSWADGRTSGEELHGTAKPADQGKDVSHGCMRHYNEDILVITDALAVGDMVAVVGSLNDKNLKK